ncbi:ABC transporter permease [Candidatus Acetothermia bacterium]|nr:ABC transporter permease [Candidatus Acetothermia bacterium]MBI3459591.1 ABC transporter permease [Candidatus Acetothermia bacterium]
MRFRHAFIIWQKEILDAVRDRRSLIIAIIVPLLVMPIFTLGPSYLRKLQVEETQQSVQGIVIQNADQAPALVAALKASHNLKLIEPKSNDETALQEGKLALIVNVPQGFEEKLSKEEKTSLEIRFNPTKSTSQTARDKFDAVLRAYQKQIVAKRLEVRKIPVEVFEPFSANYQNVASREQLGGFVLSFFLPLFLIMWAAIGGSQAAIDTTAGEKDRKTLEMLLVTPAGRSSIVLGKILAVFTVTMVATLMIMLGFALSFTYGAQVFGDVGEQLKFSLQPIVAVLMFLVSAGVAAMMSAWTFALFSWARSLREAQSYTTWISFGSIVPAMAVQFRETAPSLVLFLIPLLNATLVFKELLLGEINGLDIGVTLASSFVYALIGLGVATQVFQNEKVLFRQ